MRTAALLLAFALSFPVHTQEDVDSIIYKMPGTLACPLCWEVQYDYARFHLDGYDCVVHQPDGWDADCTSAHVAWVEDILAGHSNKIQVKVCGELAPYECNTVYVRAVLDNSAPCEKYDWMWPHADKCVRVKDIVVTSTVSGVTKTSHYDKDLEAPIPLYPPEGPEWPDCDGIQCHPCEIDLFNLCDVGEPPEPPCGQGPAQWTVLNLAGQAEDRGDALTVREVVRGPDGFPIARDAVELADLELHIRHQRAHPMNERRAALPMIDLRIVDARTSHGLGFAAVHFDARGQFAGADSYPVPPGEVDALALAAAVEMQRATPHAATVYFAYAVEDGALIPHGRGWITQPECCRPPPGCDSPDVCK